MATLARWRILSQKEHTGEIYQGLLNKWSAANQIDPTHAALVDVHADVDSVSAKSALPSRSTAEVATPAADPKPLIAESVSTINAAQSNRPPSQTAPLRPYNTVVYSAGLPTKNEITPQQLIQKFREYEGCAAAEVEFLKSEELNGRCWWSFALYNIDLINKLPAKQVWKGNIFLKSDA